MYFRTFGQFKKQLQQMLLWFDKAAAFAKAKSFEEDRFLHFRLAPDQFNFARQVQIACDTAKLGASRLTGKEAPQHKDEEKTLDELRTRIQATVAYLETFSESDFAGAATISVTQPRWEGKSMTGADYFMEHVLPNFFFHASHVYALLRHAGVDVGKRDYLGPLTMK
jgi:hypothetical protein